MAKRVVAASFKDVFVAGDVGPLGVRIAPYGRVSLEEAREAFAEQLCAGRSGRGLDRDRDHQRLVRDQGSRTAAQSEVCDLPVVASVTFTRDDRTLLGDNPSKVARVLAEEGADVIGVNCSGGPSQLLRLRHA